MSELKGKRILMISPEGWGQNFVSKHHYAYYLAKHNEVYFLNPPLGSKIGSKKAMQVKSEKIQEGLTAVNYLNKLPKLNSTPKAVQASVYRSQAKHIQQTIGIENFDVVWSFDPYRFWNLKVFKADKYIYHTVDVHFRKCFEQDVATSADLVLLSSELLRDNLKSSNKNIHYSGHGADIDTFDVSAQQKQNLDHKETVCAGLVGNFNNNVDYELIDRIVSENPGIFFYFIGPYKDNNLGNDTKSVEEQIKHIQRHANVSFKGSVPSKEIMSWLMAFDINMVLYKEEKRDIIINPHKMMGYFYSGNVTVCSWFNEYKDAEKELLVMCDTNAELPQTIGSIANGLEEHNSEERKQLRRQFAEENDYKKKIEQIAKLLYR